jgi:hypothetical protein
MTQPAICSIRTFASLRRSWKTAPNFPQQIFQPVEGSTLARLYRVMLELHDHGVWQCESTLWF